MHKYEMAKATKDAWLESGRREVESDGKMAGGVSSRKDVTSPHTLPQKKGGSQKLCFFAIILVVENSAVVLIFRFLIF